MTRKQQIHQAASKRFISNLQKRAAFVSGATWSDKNPKSPWISVKDRLPEGECVIFMDNNGSLYLGHHYLPADTGRTWFADGGFAMMDDEVTHWMPIPELQKGE